MIWTWKSPRANRAGGAGQKGQWAPPVFRCERWVKGFPDGCLATLWFHFNRLTLEPFLTDKGNENKSLSSAQQDEGKAALVCLCVYHTPISTEDRRSSTLPLITYVFELPLSPSSCHLNFLLIPTNLLERLTFTDVLSDQLFPFHIQLTGICLHC